MLAGIAIVVILLVGFGTSIARAVRRRQRDEIRSIGHYHERLDTLHVSARDRGGSVRVVDVDAPVVERAPPGRPRLRMGGQQLGHTTGPGAAVRDGRHGRTWALGRTEPRARIDAATILIVASVVAAVVVLGIVGYVLGHDHLGAAPTTPTTTKGTPHRSSALSSPASQDATFSDARQSASSSSGVVVVGATTTWLPCRPASGRYARAVPDPSWASPAATAATLSVPAPSRSSTNA